MEEKAELKDSGSGLFLGLLVLAGLGVGIWYLATHPKKTAATTTTTPTSTAPKYNVGDELEAWGTTLYTVQQVFTAAGPPSQPNFTAGALYYDLISATEGQADILVSTVDNSSEFVKV
jgi:hypothetical protein